MCMCVYFRVCTQNSHVCVYNLRVWTQRLCVGIYKYTYTHRVHVCVRVYFRIDTPSSHVGMYVFPYIRTEFMFVFI